MVLRLLVLFAQYLVCVVVAGAYMRQGNTRSANATSSTVKNFLEFFLVMLRTEVALIILVTKNVQVSAGEHFLTALVVVDAANSHRSYERLQHLVDWQESHAVSAKGALVLHIKLVDAASANDFAHAVRALTRLMVECDKRHTNRAAAQLEQRFEFSLRLVLHSLYFTGGAFLLERGVSADVELVFERVQGLIKQHSFFVYKCDTHIYYN